MNLLENWRKARKVGAKPADDLFACLPDAAFRMDKQKCLLEANTALLRVLGPIVPVRTGMPAKNIFRASSRDDFLAWTQHPQGEAELQLATLDDRAPSTFAPLLVISCDVAGDTVILKDVSQQSILVAQTQEAERLQALGALAGGIAHDFNNLLSVVIGAADQAVQLLDEKGVSQPREELEQIRQAAERGGALVRQLLAYARQQVLTPQNVALNRAVRSMAQMLRPVLGQGITLDLALEEPERLVRIDPSQLDRVVMNLAMNARNAMPNGGRLSISTGRSLLLEPLSADPDDVPAGRWSVLQVADTGSGISPDIRSRIFEPFFTSRARSGGSGMGLATVYGIIRQSGGYVLFDSEVGQGTRFRILLPRVEGVGEEQPKSGKVPTVPAEHQPAGLLLLVDDEAPLRLLAERALRRAGWNVVAAEDGEAALFLVEQEGLRPSILVSDVVMPGMDGPALRDRLRQFFPALPVLLVSGYAPSIVGKGITEDRLAHLAKPYRPAELVEAVRKLAAD
ncbi:ATP-binding protein [Pseudoroseomonas globiformis]|uniref:histidine kinase n=1 Tax=Teichococcus globiformis TaxID=2307229 RepID=A0ABV7G6A9_9PROT